MAYEYYSGVTTRKQLEYIMLNTQLGDILKYEPISRTTMALELRDLHRRFGMKTPYWIDGFIEDPNRWTEVAIRLDVGQDLPPLEAINKDLGTSFTSLDEAKAHMKIAAIPEEVNASEEDEFINSALEGEN